MARITNGFHHQNADNEQVDQSLPAPVTPVTPITSSPTPASSSAPNFSDLGATFNDATRALAGGLWQTAVEEGGQGTGSVHRYVNDLTTVQTGLQAEVAAGQFTGDTLTHLNTILADVGTALNNAPAATGGDAVAQAALRTAHLDILNVVNNDQNLGGTANGGFLAAPAALPDGTQVKFDSHATFADVGAIFNDFANKSLGGINATNHDALLNEANVMFKDLEHMVNQTGGQFQGLTNVHARALLYQVDLERDYVNQAANNTNPVAGRGSNDNVLDMIDIVQGDHNLAAAAHGGLAPFGDALNPTPAYQDNAAQTSFWANFIAQSNTLGQQAITDVTNHDAAASAALVNTLQAFKADVAAFDAAQGGIFGARFDNELLADKSTVGAAINIAVEGLHSGNLDKVTAAAEQLHANAADVGGNNIPLGGGTYNGDALTVADALSTAANPPPVTQSIPAPATTPSVQAPALVAQADNTGAGAHGGTGTNAGAASAAASDAPAQTATADTAGAATSDHLAAQHSPTADMAHHFHHMWG
jgi:hypothetical protein